MVECKKTNLCREDCDCESGSNGHYMAYCCMMDNRAQVDESDKKGLSEISFGGAQRKNMLVQRLHGPHLQKKKVKVGWD